MSPKKMTLSEAIKFTLLYPLTTNYKYKKIIFCFKLLLFILVMSLGYDLFFKTIQLYEKYPSIRYSIVITYFIYSIIDRRTFKKYQSKYM